MGDEEEVVGGRGGGERGAEAGKAGRHTGIVVEGRGSWARPPLSRLGLERDGAVSRGAVRPMEWSERAPGRGAVRLAGGPAREAGGWGRPVRVRLFLAAGG